MQKLVLIILLICKASYAVTDTAILAEILVNTTREIEQLEYIITESRKHTEKIASIADEVDDKRYRLERLRNWTEDAKEIFRNDPTTLEELNYILSDIKSLSEDVNSLAKKYAKKEAVSQRYQEQFKDDLKHQEKDHYKHIKKSRFKARNSSETLNKIDHNTEAALIELSKQNRNLIIQNQRLEELVQLMQAREKRENLAKAKLKDSLRAR